VTLRSRENLARVVDKSLGHLTTATIARMEQTLPWFSELDAEHRSWIGSVAHGGISGFIRWLRGAHDQESMAAEVFGVAPRALARVVSLQQTVAMVRTTIEVVESNIDDLFGPDDRDTVRSAISLYAREVAFAAADVYARAAEARGAWDARLEALVADAVLRGEIDEDVRSRAAAMGWTARGDVAVVVGHPPRTTSGGAPDNVIDDVHRAARGGGLVAICSVQGDRLVVILGDVDDLHKAAASVCGQFGPGPVVIGPRVGDLLGAGRSARSAIAGLRAATGWAGAPRPVRADDLLVERSLSGDGHARHTLVHDVYLPLRTGEAPLLATVSAYVEGGSSIEGAARGLFVHPNTVRYRLRKARDLTGLDASRPRDAYTLQVAITLGRLLAPGVAPITVAASPPIEL